MVPKLFKPLLTPEVHVPLTDRLTPPSKSCSLKKKFKKMKRSKIHVKMKDLSVLVIICYVTCCTAIAHTSCELRAPRYFSANQRSELCIHSDDNLDRDAPAECAKRLKIPMPNAQRNIAIAIELCKKATSVAPALCFNALKKSKLDKKIKMQLCIPAIDTGSADCALLLSKMTRIKDDDVLLFCTSFHGNLEMVSSCLNSKIKGLTRGDKLILCRNAISNGPVECAAAVVKTRVHIKVAVQVCQEASSTGPAECVVRMYWPEAPLVVLCKGAASRAPADCALAIKSTNIKNPERALLCSGAINNSPAECANDMRRRHLSLESILKLCPHVTSNIVTECLSTITGLPKDTLHITLCEAATSIYPALCFNKSPSAWSDKERIELCKKASSDGPNRCVAALKSSTMPVRTQVQLCQEALSDFPSQCMKKVVSSSLQMSEEEGILLCRGATSLLNVNCVQQAPVIFTDEDKVTLCKGSLATVESTTCASQYSMHLTSSQKATLCYGAVAVDPVVCFNSSPRRMSIEDRLTLCLNAKSTWSSTCATELIRHEKILPTLFQLDVCKGAVSSTPKNCALHAMQNAKEYTAETALECHTAIAAPYTIDVLEIRATGLQLVPNVNTTITVMLLDQFGIPIEEDMDLYVSVVDSEEGEKSENVRGSLRSLTTRGIARFEDLLFTEPGNYILTFRGKGLEPGFAHIQVRESSVTRGVKAICDRLFAALQCSNIPSTMPTVKQFFLITNEWYLHYALCSGRLHEAGISLESQLQHHAVVSVNPISYKMLSEIGIPTSEMAWWQVLEVNPDASLVDVKKAYKKKSLEWHPDRWAAYNRKFRNKAESIFQLISAAYTSQNTGADTTQ